MQKDNACNGFLCSHVDSCNKKGDCKDCELFCDCILCLFDYTPNSENCYMFF